MVALWGFGLGKDVPAAVYTIVGAVYGTASGIIESTMPAPRNYVPQVFKVWCRN